MFLGSSILEYPSCPFLNSFWMDVISNILSNISSCRCLSLSAVVVGILIEGMDVANYVLTLGKSYFWRCRHKDIKLLISHYERILENKYETENIVISNQVELSLSVLNGNPMKNCF